MSGTININTNNGAVIENMTNSQLTINMNSVKHGTDDISVILGSIDKVLKELEKMDEYRNANDLLLEVKNMLENDNKQINKQNIVEICLEKLRKTAEIVKETTPIIIMIEKIIECVKSL